MSEIAQFRRSEIETVKSYLSCPAVDRFRPPYGRAEVSMPRQMHLCRHHQLCRPICTDPSGNRRFWPLCVWRQSNLDKVAQNVDPALGRGGRRLSFQSEIWWLSARLERLAAREQQGRLELDPWHDQIADFLAASLPGAEVTIAQLLTKLGVEDRAARALRTKCASATCCGNSATCEGAGRASPVSREGGSIDYPIP